MAIIMTEKQQSSNREELRAKEKQKTGSRNFLASQDVLPSLINFLVFLLACSMLSGLVRMSQKAGSKQNKICQTWEKGVVA